MTIPGDTAIGSIVVQDKISSGTSGDLYLGRQPGLERNVVLRKLRRDLLSSSTLLEHFRREARLGARTLHPNVVQVFDLFADHGDHYLVLEHVDGPDLREVIEQAGRLPSRIARCITLEAARGTEELHRRGILHCDLRPENIRVSRWGEIKITGLGTARELGETDPPVPHGPTPYMAPEVAGEGPVDEQADVFSLGALLHELIAGDAPSGQRALLRGVGPGISWAIRRCLSPTPSQRPRLSRLCRMLERSLGEIARDPRLEIAAWLWEARILSSGGPEAGPSHPTSTPWSPRIPRLVVAGLGASLLVAATVGVILSRPPGPEAAPPTSASLPAVSTPTASAPPERTELAQVAFVVHPWAEIQIDGETPFLTPRAAPLELSPGPHEIVLRHPRYGEVKRTLQIRPGEQRVVRHVFRGEIAR